MKETKHTCIICGKDYIALRSNSITCSSSCRVAYHFKKKRDLDIEKRYNSVIKALQEQISKYDKRECYEELKKYELTIDDAGIIVRGILRAHLKSFDIALPDNVKNIKGNVRETLGKRFENVRKKRK